MRTHDPQALDGLAALVTGGTRGIGLAIAEALLAAGAKVTVTGRKEDGVRAAVSALEKRAPGRVHGAAAHSARPEDAARAFAEAEGRFGTVRILVNNAATNPSMSPLSEIDLPAFDKTIETNLRGYLIASQEAAQRMRAAGAGGSIINVSTVASVRPWPGLGAYAVSKAAVNMVTQVLAGELGPHGIRVNGIAPGVVRTKFSEALWKDPKLEERTAARLPLRRIAEPADIAGAVVFLASDAARYVTGQTIVVDGGMLAT